jgi:hypothetical protein
MHLLPASLTDSRLLNRHCAASQNRNMRWLAGTSIEDSSSYCKEEVAAGREVRAPISSA